MRAHLRTATISVTAVLGVLLASGVAVAGIRVKI